MEELHYLHLNSDPVRFESVSNVNAVFFDESNKQVIGVRSNGAGGIVVKGKDESFKITLRIEDRGELLSIKLSPDNTVMSLQRSLNSVDFINMNTTNEAVVYTQACRKKTVKLLGFFWPSLNEVVFVTDKGLEHYQVFAEKMTLKLIKFIALETNWFLWLAKASMCVVSTGSTGSSFYPISFTNSVANRLAKFEIDVNDATVLRQKDFLLATIYTQSYLISLKSVESNQQNICLYHIKRDGHIRKSNILLLDCIGKIAINIIDNLIAVHHQPSKTSYLFDIQIVDKMHNGIIIHKSIVKPLSIQPVRLSSLALSSTSKDEYCDLYSSSWVIFSPNIILDAKLGCYWFIELDLSLIYPMIPDKISLVDFLLSRKNSKPILLKYCSDISNDILTNKINLPLLNLIFERFNRSLVNRIRLTIEEEKHGLLPEFQVKYKYQMKLPVMDQSDVLLHLFVPCSVSETPNKYISTIVVEYIHSLSTFQIPVTMQINEYLFKLIVKEKQLYCLYQYLQYHLILDSREIAYELLGMANVYPPAFQLALDMFKRLHISFDSILEIFLSKKLVLKSIRYAIASNSLEKLNVRRCLEVTKETKDDKLVGMLTKFLINNDTETQNQTSELTH